MGGRTASWLLMVAVGCAPSRAPVSQAPMMAVEARAVRDVIALALDLDLAASPAADTLLDEGALIISNGRERVAPPRFAGLGAGGVVTVASVQVEIAPGGLAWAFASYRWTGDGRSAPEIGTATIVLKQRAGGWKITHAHSSQQLPWQ